MFFVGIDVAKRSHEAVITDDKGGIVHKSFSFSNNCTGYNQLLVCIRRISNQRGEFTIGMESTSHYWLALYTRLKKDGYTVYVINPLQSDSMRGMYIRKSKTDARDSFLIAEVLRFGVFSNTQVPQEKLLALRELCRNRFFLMDCTSDLKRKTIAILDQVFPEYETLFSDVFGETSLALLSQFPTPDRIRSARTSTIEKLIHKVSRGRFGLAKAAQIKQLAKDSFGVDDVCGVYSTLILTFIRQIQSFLQSVEEIDDKIQSIMQSFETAIASIPGIGPILGAVILSEVGDISRFKSADKLAAFAGIDPTVKQSGEFTGTKNHMSKRGTPYLRRALWMASTIAVQHDPMFKAFYEKKSAEGLRYMTIIGHVTKKMTSVIFAVLRDNKPYFPRLPQISA